MTNSALISYADSVNPLYLTKLIILEIIKFVYLRLEWSPPPVTPGDAVHFYKPTSKTSMYKYVLASVGYAPSLLVNMEIDKKRYLVSDTDEKLYLVSELLPDHRLKQEFFELYKLPKTASPW